MKCWYCDRDTGTSLDVCNGCRDCISCGEGDPRGECRESKVSCGHHCNHIWTHDSCCWCKYENPKEDC